MMKNEVRWISIQHQFMPSKKVLFLLIIIKLWIHNDL